MIEETIHAEPIDDIEYPGQEEIAPEPQVPQASQESSPYFPDIPDSVAFSATEDVSQKYEQGNTDRIDFHNGPTAEAVDITPSDTDPLISREPEVAQPNIPQEIRQGQASVESVPVFDEIRPEEQDDGLIVQPGEDVPLDVESGQFVRFVATPPKQISVVVPNVENNLPLNKPAPPINVDEEGYFKPPRVEPSNTYQAGYQQIDYPQSTGGGQFPVSVNPDLIDPNDYHEDRPSFSSGTNKQAVKEYYPLGKPPPSKPAPEDISTKSVLPPKSAEATKEVSKPASSFLDFLIPSFIRGSSKTDPEGPPKPPVNANNRPRVPPPPPPPQRGPQVRPLNTFPHPTELGGKENPIRVVIGPDGIPNLPKPPGWNRPHDTLTKRKMFRLEQETPERSIVVEESTGASSLKDDEIFAEIPDNQQVEIKMPKLKLPVPPPRLPPNFNRPRPAHAPMPITEKPFSGLPRVTLERKPAPIISKVSMTDADDFQVPENSPMPKRRQLSDAGLIPDKPEFTAIHKEKNEESVELQQNAEEYKNKLSDPDFFQNITKAHVFHATNLNEDDNLRLDDPINAAPIQYSPTVFQIQDLNPFGEKPDSVQTEISEPKITEPEYNSFPPQQPQPKRIVSEQPSLAEIAPPARSVHHSKDGHIDRPEVVYEPTDVYGKKPEFRFVQDYNPLNSLFEGPVHVQEQEVTAPTEPPMLEELTESDETLGTTESSIETETTTLYIDPIAEHINKLLRHYLTTQTPMQEVPSLLFDAETGSVVLEYVSPDGEHGRVEQPIQDIVDTEESAESSTFQTFKAIPDEEEQQQQEQEQQQQEQQQQEEQQQPHEDVTEQPEILGDLPTEEQFLEDESQTGKSALDYVQFDKFFSPSSHVKDADWFIMDSEGKKRIMHQGMEEENVAQDRIDVQAEDYESYTQTPSFENDETGSTDAVEFQTESTTIERHTEGGFQPVSHLVTDPDEFIHE